MFRLAPVAVLLLSLGPILVLHFAWEPPDNRFGSALTDLATFLFCWILGFAHRDGVLRRLKPFAVAALSLVAIAYGGWYAFTRRTDRLVTVFNARAVTIYLWHEIALILAVPLIDQFWNVPVFEKYLPLESQWFMFGIGWILIALFVLLCGWVEDVAGKKKPRLVP